jgi:hypothetical protein
VQDLTNKESFDNVSKWVKIAREHTHEGVPLVVIGTKSVRQNIICSRLPLSVSKSDPPPFILFQDESSLRMVKPAEPQVRPNGITEHPLPSRPLLTLFCN